MLDLDEKAQRASKDPEYKEQFITDNESFILQQAYYCSGHAVDKSSDEWSISLIAFDQAIRTYSPEKGSFAGYARVLIRNRLIDYFRSQTRHFPEVQMAPEDMVSFHEEEKNDSLHDEIIALSERLKLYGISFAELERHSPKKGRTRRNCGQILNYMAEHPELCNEMRKKKMFPVKEVEKNLKIHRKIMERHRKYLITAVEIMVGDYPQLAEYLVGIRKEGM